MAEKKIPVATYVLGVLGLATLIRGVWTPFRGVVKKGSVAHCAGDADSAGACALTMGISCSGTTKIYSVGAGRAVYVGPDEVHVLVSNEPVVLYYKGLSPAIKKGSYVMRGRKLGTCSGLLEFGVWEVQPSGALTPIEPAAWLASRGYKPVVSKKGDRGLWCEAGRKITIPSQVHADCGLKAASEPAFALLPVSVREA